MHDLRIVSIPLQERLDVGEKTWDRAGVILQNDSLFHLAEEPVDSRGNGLLTPQILIAVESLDFTGPVDLYLNTAPRFFTESRFASSVGSWTVGGDKKFLWLCLPNGRESCLGSIWPIENDEEYGAFHRASFSFQHSFSIA
jgi:hypothetical protein